MPGTSRITYSLLWGKAVMSFASVIFCLWQHPPFCGHCRTVLYKLTVPYMQSPQPGSCPYFARLRVAGGFGATKYLSGDSPYRPLAASGTCKIALNPSGIFLQAPRPHSRRLAATQRYQHIAHGLLSITVPLKKLGFIGVSNPSPNPCNPITIA